ncbi:MAG: SDR family oxidoreductase [Pseudomonadota bacterium]
MPKTVLVTGGSRGIGAATAIMCANNAWNVVVNYSQNKTAADHVVEQITGLGGQAFACQADVADEASVKLMLDKAEDRFGQVNGLVNNAGALNIATRAINIDVARWNATFATNVLGSFLCARFVIERLVTAKGAGSIVNMSSMAAVLGGANEFIDYAASKGAVDALTLGLAREYASEGIRVNGVRPGLIDTEMHKSSGKEDRISGLLHTVPMGRSGQVEEVAKAIVFLLSEQASYITGTTVNVSGGR